MLVMTWRFGATCLPKQPSTSTLVSGRHRCAISPRQRRSSLALSFSSGPADMDASALTAGFSTDSILNTTTKAPWDGIDGHSGPMTLLAVDPGTSSRPFTEVPVFSTREAADVASTHLSDASTNSQGSNSEGQGAILTNGGYSGDISSNTPVTTSTREAGNPTEAHPSNVPKRSRRSSKAPQTTPPSPPTATAAAAAATKPSATAPPAHQEGASNSNPAPGTSAGLGSSPSPSPGAPAPPRSHSHAPRRLRTVTRPLPRVLFLHTGGTLGMNPEEAFEEDESHNLRVRAGAIESSYKGSLRPGDMLSSLLTMVPELDKFANVDLQVLFNKDSSRVGPQDWATIARALDHNRQHYDAFVVVHGTDTLAYTAAALSLMLCGFRKPIVLTGSQLPLRAPRTDARQNLLDSIQVATSAFNPPHVALQEVAVCFGGKLMRGNRTQKVNSSAYQAFDSPTYPNLATLGIGVDWNTRVLLRVEGTYKPRFKLDPRVIRIPVVPGSDPRMAYGDLYGRGVRGVVLEAFGVGNLPDQAGFGWLPWLKDQTAKGLQVCMTSQCSLGPLQPALYRAGQLAAQMGVEPGPQMTPECAAVKLMFCLKHPDLALGVPLAGEL